VWKADVQLSAKETFNSLLAKHLFWSWDFTEVEEKRSESQNHDDSLTWWYPKCLFKHAWRKGLSRAWRRPAKSYISSL